MIDIVCKQLYDVGSRFIFFFSSKRRHTRCALVTGVQTCALPISGTGRFERMPYVGAAKAGRVMRSVRLQVALYVLIAVVSVAAGSVAALVWWIGPVVQIGRASCRERVCQYV